MRRRGQVIVIVAILLMALLLLLAVAVDGGRLYIERARGARAAQAAADAGIGLVGEEVVTLAVPRQTEAALRPACVPDAGFGTPEASCTATPLPGDVSHWLTDDDRATLVGPGMQTAVAAVALDYADRNGLDATEPELLSLEVQYPHGYNPAGPAVQILVSVEQRAIILLSGLLRRDSITLASSGLSEIPQR
jgi:type II secretory pathway pseudopilin PulG